MVRQSENNNYTQRASAYKTWGEWVIYCYSCSNVQDNAAQHTRHDNVRVRVFRCCANQKTISTHTLKIAYKKHARRRCATHMA